MSSAHKPLCWVCKKSNFVDTITLVTCVSCGHTLHSGCDTQAEEVLPKQWQCSGCKKRLKKMHLQRPDPRRASRGEHQVNSTTATPLHRKTTSSSSSLNEMDSSRKEAPNIISARRASPITNIINVEKRSPLFPATSKNIKDMTLSTVAKSTSPSLVPAHVKREGVPDVNGSKIATTEPSPVPTMMKKPAAADSRSITGTFLGPSRQFLPVKDSLEGMPQLMASMSSLKAREMPPMAIQPTIAPRIPSAVPSSSMAQTTPVSVYLSNSAMDLTGLTTTSTPQERSSIPQQSPVTRHERSDTTLPPLPRENLTFPKAFDETTRATGQDLPIHMPKPQAAARSTPGPEDSTAGIKEKSVKRPVDEVFPSTPNQAAPGPGSPLFISPGQTPDGATSWSKQQRPAYTYLQLAEMAVQQAPAQRLQVHMIHEWICKNISGYHMKQEDFKNGISNALSINIHKPNGTLVKQSSTPGDARPSAWYAIRPGAENEIRRWDPARRCMVDFNPDTVPSNTRKRTQTAVLAPADGQASLPSATKRQKPVPTAEINGCDRTPNGSIKDHKSEKPSTMTPDVCGLTLDNDGLEMISATNTIQPIKKLAKKKSTRLLPYRISLDSIHTVAASEPQSGVSADLVEKYQTLEIARSRPQTAIDSSDTSAQDFLSTKSQLYQQRDLQGSIAETAAAVDSSVIAEQNIIPDTNAIEDQTAIAGPNVVAVDDAVTNSIASTDANAVAETNFIVGASAVEDAADEAVMNVIFVPNASVDVGIIAFKDQNATTSSAVATSANFVQASIVHEQDPVSQTNLGQQDQSFDDMVLKAIKQQQNREYLSFAKVKSAAPEKRNVPLAEIQSRPTRKELMDKTSLSRLGHNTAMERLDLIREGLKRTVREPRKANNPAPDGMDLDVGMSQADFDFEGQSSPSEFEDIDDLCDMPLQTEPMIHDERELVMFDGSKVCHVEHLAWG
ncbi:hypothetical protein ANO11243_022690 [Dothideomycetidae sp. 11243]|nr:hypothetical protein ANO11243_022690 [fungal sp. No.11243]